LKMLSAALVAICSHFSPSAAPVPRAAAAQAFTPDRTEDAVPIEVQS
jgi:hypothetical protein